MSKFIRLQYGTGFGEYGYTPNATGATGSNSTGYTLPEYTITASPNKDKTANTGSMWNGLLSNLGPTLTGVSQVVGAFKGNQQPINGYTGDPQQQQAKKFPWAIVLIALVVIGGAILFFNKGKKAA